MLNTKSIEQFDTKLYGTFAFRIKAEIRDDDLEAMADVMNKAFDALDEVDMLLVFQSDEGSEFGAGMNFDVLKSRFRAISNVRNYCVANAPDNAESMIEFFNKLMPVDARTFNSEHNALEYLRAQPALGSAAA